MVPEPAGPELAGKVARHLAQVEGVAAVALGGSHARGTAKPDSDLDLGIYYEAGTPLDVASVRAVARTLAGPDAEVTEIGGWGPWINGGGWLQIEGRSVDFLYRDVALLGTVLDECEAGRSRLAAQPGHPHGFHTHIYLGELHYAVPLFQRGDVLTHLKARAERYPPLLREQLLRDFAWQAGFWLDVAGKSAARGEAFYVAGCLFQCVACLVQVLYARNERFFVNEKGAVAEVMTFAQRPADFEGRVQQLLGAPGDTPIALTRSVQAARALSAATLE